MRVARRPRRRVAARHLSAHNCDAVSHGPGAAAPELDEKLVRRVGAAVGHLELSDSHEVVKVEVGADQELHVRSRLGAVLVGVELCKCPLRLPLLECQPRRIVRRQERLELRDVDAIELAVGIHVAQNTASSALHERTVARARRRRLESEPPALPRRRALLEPTVALAHTVSPGSWRGAGASPRVIQELTAARWRSHVGPRVQPQRVDLGCGEGAIPHPRRRDFTWALVREPESIHLAPSSCSTADTADQRRRTAAVAHEQLRCANLHRVCGRTVDGLHHTDHELPALCGDVVA